MDQILEEICQQFPDCTPEQIAAKLAKVPADFKLYRLGERASEAEIEANLAKLRS